MNFTDHIFFFMAFVVVGLAAWEDYKSQILPPELTGSLIFMGFAWLFVSAFFGDIGLYTILYHLIGLGGLFGFTYALMKFDFWRGGDVKLAAGLGLTIGLRNGLLLFFWGAVVAGFCMLFLIIALWITGTPIKQLLKKYETVPFVPYLFIAFILIFLKGWFV